MEYKNKIGEESNNKFGSSIKVVGYRNYNDVDIYFSDYDWTYFNIDYNSFKRGSIKCPYEPRIFNKGFIGEGLYKSKENGVQTRSYKTWYDMLKRCYDENHRDKFISYENCYVCDEWLNYQNFAEWYEYNYYEVTGEIMHIDKDILIKGNNIYSPETCIFVPQTINNLIIKRDNDRGELPIGVWYDSSRNKFKAYCCNGKGKVITIGRYQTVEEAFNAYKLYKENVIKSIADEYINYIPYMLYEALYNYNVDIND
jgi:hypothetical protein